MLRWWRDIGIDRVDMAVKRRPPGGMIWHHDLALDCLPLAWARAENVRQGEVYIRPARGGPWPLVFLDDVAARLAGRVARKYDAMVVETSAAGGCHIWLSCDRPLGEEARGEAQRWLAPHLAADPGSVSGEHLGRLAGFKNWKRGGRWVNVLAASRHGRWWDPTAALSTPRTEKMRWRASRGNAPASGPGQPDTSASGREWGWVCGQLEAGCCPDIVYARLVETAATRREGDAERYARRTLQRALERTGRSARARRKDRAVASARSGLPPSGESNKLGYDIPREGEAHGIVQRN